jgi:hypothetical protein
MNYNDRLCAMTRGRVPFLLSVCFLLVKHRSFLFVEFFSFKDVFLIFKTLKHPFSSEVDALFFEGCVSYF